MSRKAKNLCLFELPTHGSVSGSPNECEVIQPTSGSLSGSPSGSKVIQPTSGLKRQIDGLLSLEILLREEL